VAKEGRTSKERFRGATRFTFYDKKSQVFLKK
jgi:hypothetical protein